MRRGYDSLREMPEQEKLKHWPNLTKGSFDYASEHTVEYNCVAWALGEMHRLYDSYGYDFPQDLKEKHTVENYAEFFRRHGFEICSDGSLEKGMEKLALYADKNGEFMHVARQKTTGNWTSKMGDYEDVDHLTLRALQGTDYGEVVIFMRRPRQDG